MANHPKLNTSPSGDLSNVKTVCTLTVSIVSVLLKILKVLMSLSPQIGAAIISTIRNPKNKIEITFRLIINNLRQP